MTDAAPLEAGEAGIPVLVTDRCGLDTVGKAGGGIVVRADVEGLLTGLETMARADRLGMGRILPDFVLTGYIWKAVAQRYQDLYRSIASA